MNNTNAATVEIQSFQGIQEVRLETHLLATRKMFLLSEINAETANNFMMQFMHLEKQSHDPIYIFINSPGGEITSGLLIYDLIQAAKSPVYMYCTGMAASMAAIILAGGQKGRRFILPHSKTMIHEPLLSGGVGGSATSISNISNSILETKKLVNTILSKHTGKSIKEINKATSFDNYMNAEESVAFGICDEIKEVSFDGE